MHHALPSRHHGRGGFTLIELMVVIGIMGIVLTTGVPLVYRAMHKEPMRKAVSELVEVCSNARAQAILKGTPVELVFYPSDKRVSIGGSAGGPVRGGADPGMEPGPASSTAPLPPGSGRSAQFSEEITIEMLDVNLREYKDEETARVRFFPNGTSDEMTLILFSRGEFKKISLEVTTGLAEVGNVR